ncbi:hypothetical protein [Marinobacter sp.]|uniref:hypothetical protein n=1 Tax=Marinobacter sp. TaxID=50741 RepID=UPI003A9185CA
MMRKWASRARSLYASTLGNLGIIYFFFFHPRIFAARIRKCSSITDAVKFVLVIVVLTFVLEATSHRLFSHSGFDSFGAFVSCSFKEFEDFQRSPEIQQWLKDRRSTAKVKQIPAPEYMGMKFVGPGLQVATGDPETDRQNARVLEFGLSTKIAFPQYCLLDAEVPQLAFVKFGFASVLFDKVIREDIYNEPVTVIFLLTISALFSISVWYVLLRLGVVVHVRSIFLTSVYSVAIWHGLIYIPQAVIGIYYSFDENLSLRFDLMNYFVGLMLLVFASAILVLGYLFAYIKTISRSSSWRVATGVLVGAGASCLLVPLAMVPTLYLIFNFGYWIGLLIG